MLALRLRIGCSTKFQESQAQAQFGGSVISVNRH
jgi:hypothetical protein